MPILKLGVGYNLKITKKWYANLALFIDLRTGSYFRNEDQYTFLNRGLELGFSYRFGQIQNQESQKTLD